MRFHYLLMLPVSIALALSVVCTPPPPGKSEVKTAECETMEEVCAEAYRFQSYYQTMPEEEQKDMISVLNTYTEHCEMARKLCKQSER